MLECLKTFLKKRDLLGALTLSFLTPFLYSKSSLLPLQRLSASWSSHLAFRLLPHSLGEGTHQIIFKLLHKSLTVDLLTRAPSSSSLPTSHPDQIFLKYHLNHLLPSLSKTSINNLFMLRKNSSLSRTSRCQEQHH